MGGGRRVIHENMGGYFYSQGVRENSLSMAQKLQPVKAMISTSGLQELPSVL